MTAHLFRLLVFSAGISVISVPQFESLGAQSAEDSYLTPVDEDRETREPEAAYRRAVEQNLFLTPGEIARVVRLPGTVGVETVVAVYRQQSPKQAEYAVTVTQPSKSLWDPENKNGDTALKSTTILRLDAGLPKTTALAIQKVWKAMLLDVREPPESNELLLESSTQIFSAAGPDGKLLRGELEGLGAGKTAALSQLVDLLIEYCDTPKTRRPEIAHRIEKAAATLLAQIASSDGNKRQNSKSVSAPNAVLMAPQQDTIKRVAAGTSESPRTFAIVTSAPEPRLGSNIDAFRTAWGSPIREEMLVRTATLAWRATGQSNDEFPTDIFEAEVSFLDRIACGIVLRTKRRTTPDKTSRLVQPILPPFRVADFAKPRSDVNGIRIYDLEDGTSVSVKEHEGRMVIVIKGQCYLDNEAVFNGEAAKVRPPTSNH